MLVDVGTRLRDYEIVARLKAGGMATLFLARRLGAAGFARHVAIKVVHPHLASDDHFIRMFVDEALLSSKIQHPNVVHVEELGEENGTYFLVMEYVHGSSLSTLLGALAELERSLNPRVAVHIALKLAEGLHVAHELRDDKGQPLHVVHRDVSPQNVLVSSAGHVKLIDFGIAKASDRGKRTETGSLKGKIRYMSPEQAFGRAIDRRTDIYALGIVLWELLTMRRLFSGPNELAILDVVRNPRVPPPSRFAPHIPPALDAAVLRALAKDPDQRPPSALEWRRMLLEALPEAALVEPSELSEMVAAVLGDHIDERQKQLPESVVDLKPVPSDFAKNDVLRTMTVSAPGARYDDEASGADATQTSDARESVSSGQAVAPRSWVPTAAIGAVLLALGIAGGVWLGRVPAANPAAPTTPPAAAPPVVIAPAPPVTTTIGVASPTVADAGTPDVAPTVSPPDGRRPSGGRPNGGRPSAGRPSGGRPSGGTSMRTTPSGLVYDDGF